jgi:hypothetical protein
MQGYIEVAPAGTKIANTARPPKKQVEEVAALLRR